MKDTKKSMNGNYCDFMRDATLRCIVAYCLKFTKNSVVFSDSYKISRVPCSFSINSLVSFKPNPEELLLILCQLLRSAICSLVMRFPLFLKESINPSIVIKTEMYTTPFSGLNLMALLTKLRIIIFRKTTKLTKSLRHRESA